MQRRRAFTSCCEHMLNIWSTLPASLCTRVTTHKRHARMHATLHKLLHLQKRKRVHGIKPRLDLRFGQRNVAVSGLQECVRRSNTCRMMRNGTAYVWISRMA